MDSIMDIINIPMGYVMRFCNDLVNNQYLWALLLFAIIVEILTVPFGIKQQKNSIKQAKMRPLEMAIRKKYAGRDDNVTKQKMQTEIQEMYQKQGFNPMGGCLPMLIQFPIIIALYNIVINPLKYICGLSADAIEGAATIVNGINGTSISYAVDRNIDLMSEIRKIIAEKGTGVFSAVEGFADKITGVEDIPDLTIFGGAIDLAGIPSFTVLNWLLLVPVLTFVSYFFSMKINKKLMQQPAQADAAAGCSGKMMDYMMPLMSVFITFGVPAALGVYWIFKCVIGVGKQAILSVAMPIPKMTKEELAAAEKDYNSRQPKTPERNIPGGKKRSLHYIDAEDDTTAKSDTKAEPKAKKVETEEKETKTPASLENAPIKEDARREKKVKDDDTQENK